MRRAGPIDGINQGRLCHAEKSKKYIVRLTDAERESLQQIVGKFKGSSQKVRRAQVLLKADADGPGWTDAKIAEAFGCRTKTVENIRERFVTQGFEIDAQRPGRGSSRRVRSCSMENRRRR